MARIGKNSLEAQHRVRPLPDIVQKRNAPCSKAHRRLPKRVSYTLIGYDASFGRYFGLKDELI